MDHYFYKIFPLSIFKGKINVKSEEKEALANLILNQSKSSKDSKKIQKAWTGDVNNHQHLLKNHKFKVFLDQIKNNVFLYLYNLGIDKKKINLYLNRSWGTVSENEEKINLHKHSYAHISFAYHIKKSHNSGDLCFKASNFQNEFTSQIFTNPIIRRKLINKDNEHNSDTIRLDSKEDDIFIFPSKTLHFTQLNNTKEPRISISGDITITLKNSDGFENLLTPTDEWLSLND